MTECQARLVIDQIRIASLQALSLRFEQPERVDRFDGSLFAAESGNVAARAAVRRPGVDERPRAVIRAEVTGGRIVIDGCVAEADCGIEADEGRPSASLHDAQR